MGICLGLQTGSGLGSRMQCQRQKRWAQCAAGAVLLEALHCWQDECLRVLFTEQAFGDQLARWYCMSHSPQVVTIKTIAVEAIAGKPGDASQPAAAGAVGRAAGGLGGKPGNGSSAAATAAGQAGLSRVGASPFAVLGSPASGVTMLGGSSSGSLGMPLSTVGPSSSSAKDRAAAAARRVPSPEPQPQLRKEKMKKVVWVDAEALVGVRWFLKVGTRVAGSMQSLPRTGRSLGALKISQLGSAAGWTRLSFTAHAQGTLLCSLLLISFLVL